MSEDFPSLPPRKTTHRTPHDHKTKGDSGIQKQISAGTPVSLVSTRQDTKHVEAKPQAGNGKAGKNHLILSMIILVLAVFMAILDTTIVNVSIPKMMAVFGVSTHQIQWVITAYTLVVGALVPVTGYLGDRFGYKKIFLLSLAFFTAGSALCGLAWNNNVMIIFRILQAIGGGAIMPISMAISFRMFPAERRGLAMGIFGIAIMFAPAFGPTIGGYITEYLDWRLIFYINVPIGIADFFLAAIFLHEIQHFVDHKFDLWGFLSSSVGFASLLYGLGIVATKGWTNAEVISFLVLGIISLSIFVAIELNVKYPMLDLRLMKNSVFTLSILITSVASIVLFASLFLLPVFLQNISGLSPLQTGLVMLPQGLVMGMMMPLSGFLFDKIGARILAFAGLIITTYSFYLMQFLDVNTSFATVSGWLMIRAVGLGLVMMPLTTAGMNTVAERKVGQASAITNTSRQVSASFGIAWLATLLSQRQTFHSTVGLENMSMFSSTVRDKVNQLTSSFSALGMSDTSAHAAALKTIWGKVQVGATVQAIDDIFWIITWLTGATILLSLFLKNNRTHKKRLPIAGE